MVFVHLLLPTQDEPYTYDVEATDPDVGDTLTYSLTTAPTGMTIDSSTGLIQWTPDNSQVGENDVTARVEDSGGLFDTQDFTIIVVNVNDPPVITSTPITTATEDVLYIYDVEAEDPDVGDVLTYSLNISPSGMTISASTGLIQWTPTGDQIGDNGVVVRVTDLSGAAATQSFTIVVEEAPNKAPVITSTPVVIGTEGVLYEYDVEAEDADGDTLTFTLTTFPEGMTIDTATGLINWTPSGAQSGSHSVTVEVSDGRGGIDIQSFAIVVAEAINNPPVIISTPITAGAEDVPYEYKVEATDADGDPLTYSLTIAPEGMTIDPTTGLIQWTMPVRDASFTEVSAYAGVYDVKMSMGTGWVDYDNDQDLDLYVANECSEDRLYRNNGDGTFTNVAAIAGVDDNGVGVAVSWGDYDNDGDVDLYLVKSSPNYCRRPSENRLYRNNGDGTFTDVAAIAGVDEIEAGDAAFGDYDNDGDLDLYLGGLGDGLSGTNRLLRNNGDGTFTDVASRAGIDDAGWGYAAVWGDYDNDGHLDLYLCERNLKNRLYRNNGDGTFTDVAHSAGVDDPAWGYDAEWVDYNNDGYLDLYLANIVAANRLYRNNRDGTFTDVAPGAGVDDAQEASQAVAWGDYDNDGDLDLYLANTRYPIPNTYPIIYTEAVNRLYRNNGDGTFTDIAPSQGMDDTGNAQGAAWGDYDNDGDLDLYLTNWNDPAPPDKPNRLYRNNKNSSSAYSVTAEVSDGRGGLDSQSFVIQTINFLFVRPVDGGGRINRHATIVRIYRSDTGTLVGMRTIDGGSNGYTSHNSYDAHFGVSAVETYDIEVIFPGGIVVDKSVDPSLGNVNPLNIPNGYIEVRQSSSTPPTITSTPVRIAAEGELYVYDVEATDADGDELTYSLTMFPAGMTIEPSTGLIEWVPSAAQLGINEVNVTVSDGRGGSASQTFAIHVGFTEVGAQAGVDDDSYSNSSAWGDYDNDGDLDLYVANDRFVPNCLYRNNGDGTFTDVAASAGVANRDAGVTVVWGDYNNDGYLDLYLANSGSANSLYKNNGDGTFTDVAATAGVTVGGGGDAAFGDYDNDGYLDLYVTMTDVGKPAHLYRNNGDGTFKDMTASAGINNIENIKGAVWGDYDNDSDLDLYITNRDTANRLYRNNGNGTFTDVAPGSGVAYRGAGLGATWGDYDNDGDLDLYLINYRSANLLYRNNGDGTFTNVAAAAGVDNTGYEAANASWGDYNNDGYLDIYVCNTNAMGGYKIANRLFRNNGDGTFDDVIASTSLDYPGSSLGIAWGDYDNDGDLDFYITRNGPNKLYQNNQNNLNYLFVRALDGGCRFNRHGAIVRVFKADTTTLVGMRTVEGGSNGYRSQNAYDAHFGLDAAGRYDVEVTFPDGTLVDKSINPLLGNVNPIEVNGYIQVCKPNSPPVVASTPVTTGAEGALYTYDVNAVDADGDVLTYLLSMSSAGMAIDASTGLIRWTPLTAQIGTHNVTVEVSDGRGGISRQSFTITVVNVNDPPVITSTPVTVATEEVLYTYDVEATDPDAGDVLIYSLTVSPSGMTIDSAIGLIQWTPTNNQVGSNPVTVRVADVAGATTTQSFIIIVANINDPPTITSTPVTASTEDVLYTYNVEATDPDAGDVLTYSLTVSPAGMTIDPVTGLIQWTPTNAQVGDNSVTVQVADVAGARATQSFTVAVYVNDPPVITSSPVTMGTEGVAYSYDMEASDPDVGDVLTYSLITSPAGMTIDASIGLISWTPSGTQAGSHGVTVQVSDGRGGTATQSFVITVTEAINTPPVITSVPVLPGTQGISYTYDVEASDADGDTLVYALTTSPSGMTINASTGLIQWTPTNAQVGANGVIIQVSDGRGGIATQSFTVTVANVNDPPIITSAPVTTATADVLYAYDVEAADPDVGDVLTFSLTTSPAGMTIDASTGLVQWTPTNAQVGDNNVTVRVSDVAGATSAQSFTITVAAAVPVEDYTRPAVTITTMPSPPIVNVGGSIIITVTATDDVGVVSRALTVNDVPVPLDASGKATYSPPVAGIFTAVGTARDAAGNEGLDSAELRFLSPGDTTPPTVAISSPADDSKLSVPTDIIGTASDANLTRYTLEYSVKDKNEFIIVAQASLPVINGVLGNLDTTMMKNGLYDVRLSAEDASGNTASISRTYQIEGEMKVGNFTISFNDLTIPVVGIPITITRTYDSRVKTKGDFGVGWTMDVSDFRLNESRVMGEGWEQTSTGGWLPWYIISPTMPHYVTVTYPDGRIDEFDMQINPDRQQLAPISVTTASFFARSGTFSSLVALDINPDLWVPSLGTIQLLDQSTLMPYDPDRYQLTAMDGTVYIINQHTGLESISDTNGNTIIPGPDGIIHSAGKSVTFTRDAQGRITAITDPMGNTIQYEYDYYGDLVSVTDQEGNATRFTYNSNHDLIDIIDPLGITPARNEYDDEGRFIAIVDADGNRTEFTHNIGTRQEVVRDRLANVTVYEYDTKGNVISKTDALGNRTEYTYDARGNQLSETDPLGNTTTYTYDAKDNMLSKTDPPGNTTTYTYNSRSQVLTITDPLGNVTTNAYDARGNLTSMTDALGNVTTYTYDASGNQTSTADPLGNVTTYTYNASGNMISQTDPLGNVITYTYDANGNQLSEMKTRTTLSGAETITTTNVYDSMNWLVQTIDPYGNTTSMEYNALGNQSAIIDKLGNRTEYEYDVRGNLIRVTYPYGTDKSYTYDVENRRLTSTDRAGRTTSYTYDRLGRLTQTIFPDGMFTQTEYDAASRITRAIDERGNATQYTYDAAGQNISVIDALGNTTAFGYDRNGNRVRMTDARGNITQYEYDANNQRTRTVFLDGTSFLITYDALGRKISETDQAGRDTQFQYDALGRLIRVTDALGNVTRYAYDEVGNMISQTDANGHTTRFEYDKLGRQTKRTLPLGMAETAVYNAARNIVSQTDFNGNTITFQYDVNGRLISKNFPDGTSEIYTHTATGQRETVTDSRGITTYEYDQRDRLTQQTNPDGRSISYTYDAAGNRTSVTIPTGTTNYAFDALNRLATVTDPDGGVTTYTYDAIGNRASVTYPNGTVAEYTYDSLNRLTDLVNRKSSGEIISSYAYTLGPTGNRTRVVENTGRTVDYIYDATYKLTQERINDPVSGLHVISYVYDPVGNRLTKTDNGITTTYIYDANGRLLTENDITYTYDYNGNTMTKVSATETVSYSYNFQNRLIQANVTDASGSSVVEYVYDVDGIRVQKTVDGTDVTSYLVDKSRPFAQVLLETDALGAPIASYVYGDDLISQKRDLSASYYHYDGQMSTRQLTDLVANVTDTYDYEAFGLLLQQSGSTLNNYLYNGEQYDPNVGFYYLRARYLNSKNGRFLSSDEYPADLFDPSSLHRYVYVANNPINQVDPSGCIIQPLATIAVIGLILSKMLPNVIIAATIIAGIEIFWKPGFEMRNGALEIIAASTNEEILAYAFRIYQHGSFLISLGAAAIDFAVAIERFALSSIAIKGLATAVGALAIAANAVLVFNQLDDLNSRLESIETSLNRIAEVQGQNSNQVNIPRLRSHSTTLSKITKEFFSLVLKILLAIKEQ